MTSTVMGRCFFAIGAFFVSSLFYGRNDDQQQQHHHLHVRSNNKPTTIHHRTHAAEQDRITDLPGLDRDDPGFEQFAGYFDVSDTRHVFYWYVESQNDPEKDPVVLWTNGGPGCSGLLGFATEHGPYYISKRGKLHENPYSWNKIANMLYIEQPAGVGFSYTDNPVVDTITGDAQAARDNYNLILQFLKKFPERTSNEFYIASESYGGHYIPQLALEILQKETDNKKIINFKGMMVGNPFVDPFSNTLTQFAAYYSHGLLPKPLYDNWERKCNDRIYFDSVECKTLAEDLFRTLGQSGINPYALDYPVCTYKLLMEEEVESVDAMEKLRTATTHAQPRYDAGFTTTSSSQVETLWNHTGQRPPFLPPQDEFRPCSQVFMEHYLNQHDVRKALHVLDNAAYKWSPCGGVKYSETDVNTPTTALYQELVDQAVAGKHHLNMFVFSGDDDSVCSTAGTQYWIWNLGVEASSIWKPWKVDDQTAGFVTHFDLGGSSNNETTTSKARFAFATVHGAGHEVPAYRPMEALELFTKFLNEKW